MQGSTGGAGLRALEGDDPTPITLTVLYLDRTSGALQAYDEITLGGLGDNEVRIARVVAPQEPLPEANGGQPEPAGGSAMLLRSPTEAGGGTTTPPKAIRKHGVPIV